VLVVESPFVRIPQRKVRWGPYAADPSSVSVGTSGGASKLLGSVLSSLDRYASGCGSSVSAFVWGISRVR
jgi:hypothetical protein